MSGTVIKSNKENDSRHRVKKIYSCHQAEGILSGCYGYTEVWAHEGDDKILPDVRTESPMQLQLTRRMRFLQATQFMNGNTANFKIYKRAAGLRSLVDDIQESLAVDEAAMISLYDNLLGGHTVALRKLENGLEFFDCNAGKYFVKDVAAFKSWFSNYLRINYQSVMFTYEIAREVDTTSSILNSLSNLGWTLFVGVAVILLCAAHLFHELAQCFSGSAAKENVRPQITSSTKDLSSVFSQESLKDKPHAAKAGALQSGTPSITSEANYADIASTSRIKP